MKRSHLWISYVVGGVLGLLFAWHFISADLSMKRAQTVHIGMSKSQVIATAGEPQSTQEITTEYGNTSYWYYGRTQIGFNEDTVKSVSTY